MNYRTDILPRMAGIAGLLMLALLCCIEPAAAQKGRIRLGFQTGAQTSVLRYAVAPYTGSFQSTIDEGGVYGISASMDVNTDLTLMLDVEWKNDGWSEVRGEDPLISVEMAKRTTLLFPLLLRYRPSFLPVPLYVAAGAAMTLIPDNEGRFMLTYEGFSERDGWRSYSFTYDQAGMSLLAVAEAGLDVDLGASFSMLLSARYQAHMKDIVDSERFSAQSLSVWRLRAALYLSL